MTKKLLTERTKLNLIDYAAQQIEKKSRALDKTKQQLVLIKNLSSIGLTSEELEDVSRILEFKMLIGFVSLDLTTCVRSYLKAEFQYEGQYFLRQFSVVINEGYKKIYNFNKENSNGTKITKNRAKSIWVNHISRLVGKRKNSNLEEKYLDLTRKLDHYLDKNFAGIKKQRDISIHYDEDLLKVYDTISYLSSDEMIRNNFVPFYELLDSIFVFTHELLMSYEINQLK